MLTEVPATPIVGVKLLMVGATPCETVNGVELVALPLGDITEIGPVVAPVGTWTTNCVAEAELIVAAVPLKFTVSWLAVAENPDPEIVTVVPTGPLCGENPRIATAALPRAIAVIFPAAS